MSRVIKIGTRKSKLALWQANQVKNNLERLHFVCEIVPIESQGDIQVERPLHELGITGIFTKTLDIALLNKEIDLAVHSLKDVPTILPNGIIQSAVLERFNPSDVVVFRNEKDLKDYSNSIIATGSLRRKAQWLNLYPKSEIVGLRGNIDTRLEKVKKSNWTGGIFAGAGLDRLGIKPNNSMTLSWMIPAPAQGVIMLAARENDDFVNNACSSLNHMETQICSSIERDFLKKLEGGCTAPIGALATINNKTKHIDFQGILLSRDGKKKLSVEMSCELQNQSGFGEKCAQEILNQGGKELIKNDNEEIFSFYSTKKLSSRQKRMLPENIHFEDRDFIDVSFIDIPEEVLKIKNKNVIITSKNGVESIMRSSRSFKLDIENIFCVGEKTKELIEQNIGKVKLWKKNSKELALEMTKIISGQKAIYFCGNLRLDTLPAYLKENNILVEEIISYSTRFNPTVLDQNFSAVLFFSPSAVKSFMILNSAKALALCIGEETALEARKYFSNVQIANTPDSDSLLELLNINIKKNIVRS